MTATIATCVRRAASDRRACEAVQRRASSVAGEATPAGWAPRLLVAMLISSGCTGPAAVSPADSARHQWDGSETASEADLATAGDAQPAMPNDADLEDAAGSQDADTVGARGADTADAALDVQDDATALVADATDDPADVPGPADSAESGGAADLGGAPDTAAAPDVPTATDAQAGKDGNDGLDGASAQDAGDAAGPDLAPPPIKPQDPTQLPKVAFADITATFGVDPAKVHGACVGIGDFDGNGHDDFLVIEVDKTKATIHAVLLGGATVKHVYTPFDTTMLLPSTGCSVVDLDSDGKLDLLAGGHAGAAFYAGDGKGSFVDHTDKWLPYIMDFATLTLAPVDLDGDGDLDLFVGAGVTPMTSDGGGPGCGSLNCGYQDSDFICSMMMPFPEAPASLQDRVLIQGAKLPLVDQTKAWGVPPGGMWSNAQPLDVDADGKMDVLVGDDFGAHRLLRNVGGKFAAYSTDIGFHSYGHGMGWGVGDLNGDGLADLIMADAGPNPLFLQGKAPAGMPVGFEDAGGPWGLWSPTWMASTWSPLIADFDQDGYDDVMMGVSISTTNPDEFPNVAAGCAGTAAKPYDGYPNPDVLFLSAGSASSWQAFQFPSGPYSHFAMVAQATIDLDGDGDLDLVQTRPNAKMTSLVRVVRNDLPNKGKSLFVHVKGKPGNLDALGTVITAKVGGALRTRYLVGSGGTGGTRSRVAHFGLGNAASAKDVTIRWPNGKVTKLGELQAGTHTSATWPVQCM